MNEESGLSLSLSLALVFFSFACPRIRDNRRAARIVGMFCSTSFFFHSYLFSLIVRVKTGKRMGINNLPNFVSVSLSHQETDGRRDGGAG